MSVYSLSLDILLIASVKLKTIKRFFILSSTKNAVTAFGVMNILLLYNWKYLKTLKIITLKMINFLVPRCSSAPRCPCRAQQNSPETLSSCGRWSTAIISCHHKTAYSPGGPRNSKLFRPHHRRITMHLRYFSLKWRSILSNIVTISRRHINCPETQVDNRFHLWNVFLACLWQEQPWYKLLYTQNRTTRY